MSKLDLSDDIIDVRDIIARVEELEDEREAVLTDEDGEEIEGATFDEQDELDELHGILHTLKGRAGDEQWRGSWYPLLLIRESHFVDYCQQELEDCGTIPADLPSWVVVDWNATAENMKDDYSEIDIEGATYFYR